MLKSAVRSVSMNSAPGGKNTSALRCSVARYWLTIISAEPAVQNSTTQLLQCEA